MILSMNAASARTRVTQPKMFGIVYRVRKRGSLGKGVFSDTLFSRDSREFRDSRDFRESPDCEKREESNHFLEILENLEILEIPEITLSQ